MVNAEIDRETDIKDRLSWGNSNNDCAMEDKVLKSQHVKAMDHSDNPEKTQEGLHQSWITSDAKTHEERAIRAEAWASQITKMQREHEKQKSESVPLCSTNHISPMDAVIASWERKPKSSNNASKYKTSERYSQRVMV
ncbi:hypothetical protein BT96DRAFT_946280 [Gymnopus androsaceus JB14]|uniref:Uncharacterized protein n=1 Tax=Gymnopus androsaceus JB14 TaxID=1447944 RepID=A0A6A4GWU2_9AGAR|nr:hypothetical protein BT96DRAFT_946280 [Gymnopus androsaceus JB14]